MDTIVDLQVVAREVVQKVETPRSGLHTTTERNRWMIVNSKCGFWTMLTGVLLSTTSTHTPHGNGLLGHLGVLGTAHDGQ